MAVKIGPCRADDRVLISNDRQILVREAGSHPTDAAAAFDLQFMDEVAKGERLDNDPSGARYGCFLPDLTGLARRLPAPTSQIVT